MLLTIVLVHCWVRNVCAGWATDVLLLHVVSHMFDFLSVKGIQTGKMARKNSVV